MHPQCPSAPRSRVLARGGSTECSQIRFRTGEYQGAANKCRVYPQSESRAPALSPRLDRTSIAAAASTAAAAASHAASTIYTCIGASGRLNTESERQNRGGKTGETSPDYGLSNLTRLHVRKSDLNSLAHITHALTVNCPRGGKLVAPDQVSYAIVRVQVSECVTTTSARS